ncbi:MULTISPECIES: CsbD family protein [Sphingosinicellaceae]|uniref:CsbD family protein n=1 Tax=Sphingosinicellaceae TaxID=2820280 RepID=UPI001C1E54BF|nr:MULTISPECIES: CsbD family protein [Polymorphobacter]QYE36412.1 CsbD family protein [Polymorphobacter sp. PAMC 29334]UAJ10105.1 CsbD family protein [Polymorphobacter megasporae]
MNDDEFHGGARYVGGKVEKAIGDVVDSRDWKVDGVVDQVAGGVQHSYGRAKSIVENVIDNAPELAAEARDRLKAAGERLAESAQNGARVAAQTVQEQPVLLALVSAAVGYGLARMIHGRRD